MAYTPREIKDRVAVGDDIFIVEDLGNNRIRLIPAPTHVLEVGTPVNKALLQPMEDHMGDVANPHATTKEQVGLGNVDNVKQATKAEFDAHKADFANPHATTKEQVGLGSVQNYGIATQAQAEAGTANNVYMTPLRVKEAFDKRVVFARVNGVSLSTGTVIRVASNPTDYNTIKFDTLLPAGEDTAWFGVTFSPLGNVVVGTPQYCLSESSYLSHVGQLEFRLFQTEILTGIQGISFCQGIQMVRPDRVSFLLVRSSGTGALNDIYLHFRFTGLKLA